MARRLFLLRSVILALTRRKSRVAIALASIALGVAIVSGLANVYYDVNQKMTREFRTYGANLVLAPVSPETQPYLSLSDVSRIADRLEPSQQVGYAPYLYGAASLDSYQMVLVGTDFDQISKVSPYWKISGASALAQAEDQAIVGEALASKLRITPGSRLKLTGDNSRTQEVVVRGILSTGGKEDNLFFVNLKFAAELLNKPDVANIAYFSVAAGPEQLESLVKTVQSEFPAVAVSPIKQLSQAEGQVLTKIQSLVLLAVAIILLLTLLCLVITMMNIAMERRKEIGLKKALGGQDRDIVLEFVIEGCILGLVAGLLGWGMGLLVAQGIGQSVFHASVSVRLPVLLLAVLLATTLGAVATLIPASVAARVQPAIVLKGE
ncbi:MAG: ABC transporter permease [Dehalococcoidia bacterium]|nr:ABC transporter permease [Dehalococcoidia bacterium]